MSERPALRVDVHAPQSTVNIDIREDGEALVFCDLIKGAGGMPVGTSGKGILLLSGGIDSPVAGHMIAKRGMKLVGLHFHSYPYTNMQAREKVEDLARILARYTGGMDLYVVRVTHIQEAIHKHCPEEMMVTLLRRFMMRIAERQAESCGAQCIITGESLGQVASQTIEGMTSSNAVVRRLPVLRPLVGFDKTEIVARAREIGTFETSILPYEDCCTVFTPRHPRTKPKLETVEAGEASLPVEALVKRMMAKKPENRFASMEEVLKAIWTIRQKTAPNKSLVPDVHTISIKRLDYDIQNESSELKAKVTERINTKNMLVDRLATGFLTAVVVIIVMLMLYTIFDAGSQDSLRIYPKVAYFEKLSTDRSLDRKSVLEEGKKILDELPNLHTPEQEFNRTKMLLLIANLEQEISASEILSLTQKNSEERKQTASISAELNEMRKNNETLKKTVERTADYDAIQQKNGDLTAKNEKLTADLRALYARFLQAEKEIASRKQQEEKRDEKEIRLKILSLQRAGKFRNVDVLVASEQVKKPYLYSWLSAKDTENAQLAKIHSILTDSGTRFSGYPISGYGRIEIIAGGYIDYKTPLGELRQKEWKAFPASSLYKLLMNDSSLKRNPAAVRSACEFLLGNYGAACKADPANTELQQTVNNYAEQEIERLKNESAVDRYRTQSKVRALLERLKGAGSYANYEKELKALL